MLKPWQLFMIFCPIAAVAKEHLVVQQNKSFSSPHLSINSGESVRFINKDNIFHNIFSLSDGKIFDLGSFSHQESRSIVFEEKGKVEIECAIHPEMKMTIEVK